MGTVVVKDDKYPTEFVLDKAGMFELEYKGIKIKSIQGTGTLNIEYDKKDSEISIIFQDRDTSFIFNNMHFFAKREYKF